ncbi:MAG: cell wall-binding repeat-containing protein, partial [Parcubacteria group bacterium]
LPEHAPHARDAGDVLRHKLDAGVIRGWRSGAHTKPGQEHDCGEDRQATAASIAEEISRLQLTNPTQVAYLCEGQALVDAFSAGPAAGNKSQDDQVDYQLLNERSNNALNPATQAFLDAHKAELTTLYLLGGDQALPQALQDMLQARYPNLKITRFAGIDRFDTNAKANSQFFAAPTTVYVANGEATSIPGAVQTESITASAGMSGLFGALLAGDAAAQANAPLVLTRVDLLPAATLTYLEAHAATLTTATLVGSVGDISEAVRQQIENVI